jgi:hypothetical protein
VVSGVAGAASDAEEELKAEVVAHVKSVVRFPGMADFQYVSCDPRPLQEQVHLCAWQHQRLRNPLSQSK